MSPPIAIEAQENGKLPLLRCLNRHTEKHAPVEASGGGTTMVRIGPDWGFVPCVEAQGAQTNRGTPVALHVCVVCGYVEMYAGAVLDPAMWASAPELVAQETEH